MNIVTHIRSFTQSRLGKTSKFFLTGGIITFLTRGLDAVMIGLILHDQVYGFIWAFIVGLVWCFILSASVVMVNEGLLKKGLDITGLDELRETFENGTFERHQWISRLTKWSLNRKLTIFFVCSVIYFDPDYAVLLLRDKSKGLIHTMGLLFLSVLYSIWVWTFLYWYAVIYGSELAQLVLDLIP